MEGDRPLTVVTSHYTLLALSGPPKRMETFTLKIRLKLYDHEVKLKLNRDKMSPSYTTFVTCKLVKGPSSGIGQSES